MIDKARFGRTNHLSSRIIFGAAALWTQDQARTDRALDLLLEYGVNHIDTAASYGDSELCIGPWMDRYRNDFFLATKTEKRTYAEARDQFYASLDRLRTDHVDLLQLHYLVDSAEWNVAMGPGGVLEFALEAREQGLTRYIGVTGHDVAIAEMHLRSTAHFDFDSVLLPYSYTMMQNPVYQAKFEELYRHCMANDVAMQTIKGIVWRPWGGRPQTRTTWYEPLEEQQAIDNAVHWILGKPGVFLNSAGDVDVLPKVLAAAARFEARPTDDIMAHDLDRLEMAPLFT
jgi:aryl-alcohol dehydrogenase-like predicted oxidoreductase